MDAKIDDGRNDGEVDEHGKKVAPHHLGTSQPKRSVRQVGGKAEQDPDQRIDDVSNQRRDYLGNRTSEDKADGEPHDPLLADKREKAFHGLIIPSIVDENT